ncbi:MAG: hypothetical protein H0W89_06090 [Candidatus Levybacteria bacterium]|nr:hypothetical protein [Candidatus Levybacteria bacterium]
MTELAPGPNPDADRKNFDRLPPIESPNGKIGVDPQRGHVTSWEVKNPDTGTFVPVLYVGSELKRTGIPNLFPNYDESGGELPDAEGQGELDTHGFGRDKHSNWIVIEQSDPRKVVMQLTPENISAEARAKYPYDFETTLEVAVAEDGSMTHTMTVKNKGDKPMPIAPGTHANWASRHDQKRSIKTDIEGFDAETIDWDNDPPDTEYDFYGKAVIAMPDKTITIEEINEDGSPKEPDERVVEKIVAWSQPVGNPEKPDVDFVAFEQVSLGKGALKERPIILKKDEVWKMKVKYSATFNSSTQLAA